MSRRPDAIDVETAHEYLIEGRAQFVDARPAVEFGHSPQQIPGAVHIDPGSGANMDEALFALPRERLIIAYCDEPNHAASAQVARLARELGIGDASILEGGFRAWQEAELPTVDNLDATRGLADGPQPMAVKPPENGLAISSPSFGPGEVIPVTHTLDGDNLSPPLGWSGVPRAARSLVLLMDDRDAHGPGGAPFTHWIVYNVQPSTSGLALGANREGLPAGCREGTNDFGRAGYGGPRPPAGSRHRYTLRLFALDDTLDPAGLGQPDRERLLRAIEGYVLASAELEAVYERPSELEAHV